MALISSVFLAACGGDAERDDGAQGSTTSSSTASAASASGGAGGETSGPGGSGGEGVGGAGGSDGGAGGMGGAPSEVCAAAQKIIVSDPTLADDGQDGTWSSGEAATFTVTLTSPDDNFDYPGVSVVADHPGITPSPAENTLFGVLAGQPTPVMLGLTAAADIPPGTKVTLAASVTVLNEECNDLSSLTFEVTIE